MPTAQTDAALDYVVDWSPRLAVGETVAASAWTVPSGLTQITPAPSHTTTTTTIWLTGGVVGTSYVVRNSIVTSAGRTASLGFTVTIVEAEVEPDPYCSIAEARTQGAVGSAAAVSEAIRQAMDRVDTFTGDLFTPRQATVVTDVQTDGRAFLPWRLTSPTAVQSVVDQDTGQAYAVTAWRAFSSATAGDVDSIGIGTGWVGTNILVNGLEPWNRTIHGRRGKVRVTGTFGWSDVPPGVARATALLAALISRGMRLDDDGDPNTPTPETASSADPEGNVLPVVPPFSNDEDAVEWDPIVATRTTGSRAADAALMDYRHNRPLMGV